MFYNNNVGCDKMIKQIKNIFYCENAEAGYLYAYVHFVTEIICFYTLSRITGDSIVLWLTPFIYDMLSFVPQSAIGYFSDKYQKIPIGSLGFILMVLGLVLFEITNINYLPIIIMCIGNCFTHVAGAEATLRSSKGMMRPVAFFVSGGTVGIVLGKIFSSHNVNPIFIALIALSGIPFSLLGDTYKEETFNIEHPCENYNYAKTNLKPFTVILLATFVVMARGYMGYGIPISWNKTTIQMITLYVTMAMGKALGGVLIDKIGMRKTAFISTVCALPLLIFGDNIMTISVLGVMFFSMTMAITLGLIVSVLKDKPGLAFGYTTIGLFLGTIPIFFIKTVNMYLNAGILTILTIICLMCLNYMIRRD